MSCFKGKKVLCLAQTPFQLMSLLSIFSDEENRDFETCDLVIWDQFPSAQIVSCKLRDRDIFNAVECLQMSYPIYKHLGASYLLDSAIRPTQTEQRFRSRSTGILWNDNYDILMIGAISRFSLDAKRYCAPHGCTYFIDDGAGSHNGNVFQTFAFFDTARLPLQVSRNLKGSLKSGLRKVASRFAGPGKFRTQGIFLFCPEDSEKELYACLPVIEQKKMKDPHLVSDVFGVASSGIPYDQSDLNIYFSLPSDAPRDMLDKENRIVDDLIASGDPVAIKVHPRRNSADFEDKDASIIGADVMWEAILAAGLLREDAVLHGFVSSAQIHPKTLFGLEPKVVFYVTDFNRDTANLFCSRLKSLYHSKENVQVLE